MTSNAIFPKELLVVASVVSNLFECGISILVPTGIAYVVGVTFSWSILALPFVLCLQLLLLVLWVSLILACSFVYIRDTGHIYQIVLRLLLFTTPIFYELELLGDGLARNMALLNPLTHVIIFSRTVLIQGRLMPVGLFLALAAVNALLVLVALRTFRRLKPAFAERV